MTNKEFPTKDPYKARTVTELDFDLKADIRALDLYVDLSGVRSNKFKEDMLYQLNVVDGKLANITDDYQKILFSGHKGCGKTTELRKLHDDLNKEVAYFTILVELEKETYLSRFEPEDMFVLLLLKLLEELKERDAAPRDVTALNELAREWLSEEDSIEEVYKHRSKEGETEFSGSFEMLVELKGSVKSMWTAGSNTTKTIRTKVKQNPVELINKFNHFLAHLRLELEEKGLGKDVLFIIDGSEKMRSETYTDLFINDSMLLRQLDCNMVVAVPIDAYYTIENSPGRAFTHSVTIPMVKTEGDAAIKLKEIIHRRLDPATFFAEGVLDHFVKFSGGCVRQLLQLVNQGLMRSRGQLITMEHAQSAVSELGQRMYEQLKQQHIDLLKPNDPKLWLPGEDAVKDMLFNLSLLKYNGDSGINPLLIDKIFAKK